MAYACFLLPEMEAYTSVLAADWKFLPNSKLNLTWRIEAWKMGAEGSADTKLDEGDLVDDRKTPPKETVDPFLSVFGSGRQPRIIFPGQLRCTATTWGGTPYGLWVNWEGFNLDAPAPNMA